MVPPEEGAIARPLRALLPAFTRLILPVLVLLLTLVGILLAGSMLTLTLATPSVERLALAVAAGTQLSTLELLLTSSWAVIPVILMLLAALVDAGMILHLADGALLGRRVRIAAALLATLRRLGPLLGVLLLLAVLGLLGLALAPIVSLAALLTLLLRWRRLPADGTGWSRRRLALAAIPLAATAALLVRLAIAIPGTVIAERPLRAALRESWHRTAGRTVSTGIVLLITAGGAALASLLIAMLGYLDESLLPAVLLPLLSAVLLAPIPLIALAALHRELGGPRSRALAAGAPSLPDRVGRVLPATLAVALVVTLLTPLSPSSPAAAAPVAPAASCSMAFCLETTVELYDADPGSAWAWQGGDGVGFAGVVRSEVADWAPPGTVQLLAQGEGDTSWTSLRSALPLSGGTFSFSSHDVPGWAVRVQIAYGGGVNAFNSAQFLPSQSAAQEVRITRVGTSIVLEGAGGTAWDWEYGATRSVTGQIVRADAGAGLIGSVALYGGGEGERGALLAPPVAPAYDGAFQIDTTTAPAGTTRVWVQYLGDEWTEPGVSAEQATLVRPAETTVTLDPDELRMWNVGEPYDITGQVRGAHGTIPRGTVELWARTPDSAETRLGGGLPLDTAGRFSLDAATAPLGTDRVWVRFSGDADHAPATSQQRQVAVTQIGTQVRIDGANGEVWEFELGGLPAVTGRVESLFGTQIPTGQAELWIVSPTTPALTRIATVALDAGGGFAFDTTRLPVDTPRLRVVYLPQSPFDGATSSYQELRVSPVYLPLTVQVLEDPEAITVGDVVTIRIDAELDVLAPGFPLVGKVVLVDPETGVEYWRGALPASGAVTLSHRVTTGALRFAVGIDGDPHYVTGGSEMPPYRPGQLARSSTLLYGSAFRYGGEGMLYAEVSAPAGIPVTGEVGFQVYTGTWRELGVGELAADGVASIRVCAGTTPCAGSTLGILPFTAPNALPLPIRAVYLPPEWDAALQASTSPESRAMLGPPGSSGPGICKALSIVAGNAVGPDTAAAAGRMGTPRIAQSDADCTLRQGSAFQDGYVGGANLTLRAEPKAGYRFVGWRNEQGTTVGTTAILNWQLPDDTATSVQLRALYAPICLAFSPRITGYGATVATTILNSAITGRDGSCVRPEGTMGVYYGSTVQLELQGVLNPATQEPDILIEAAGVLGASSAGQVTLRQLRVVSTQELSSGEHISHPLYRLVFVATTDAVLPIRFGATCRLLLADAARGAATPRTAPNCTAPDGRPGYIPGSLVTLAAETGADPDSVPGGWVIDGELRADLGRGATATIRIGDPLTTRVGVALTACYPVSVAIVTPWQPRADQRPGSLMPGYRATTAETSAANCPDGSERWERGSSVSLSATAGSTPGSGAFAFGGWRDELTDPATGSTAASTVSLQSRSLLVNGPISTTVYFYLPDYCSTIAFRGDPEVIAALELVPAPGDECGPGRYLDRAKANLAGMTPGSVTRDDYLADTGSYPMATLAMLLPEGIGLALSGWAETSQRFGTAAARGWSTSERALLLCDQEERRCEVPVRGDAVIQIYGGCQLLDPVIRFTVPGYGSRKDAPTQTLLLDGSSPQALQDFDWITSDTPDNCGVRAPMLESGPQIRWRPGTDVTLRVQPPAAGFQFQGWGEVDNQTGIEVFTQQDAYDYRNPIGAMIRTDDRRPVLHAGADYLVHCAELELDWYIQADTPPNCPDGRAGAYVVGTFVGISTPASMPVTSGRTNKFQAYRGDILAGTQERTESGTVAAIVLIGAGDKQQMRVSASYPDPPSSFLEDPAFYNTLAQVGKVAVAVVALGAVAAIGAACAPCSVALAALTVSAFITDLIPGTNGWGSKVLGAINPLNVLSCTAEWGFDAQARMQGSGRAPGVSTGAGLGAVAKSVKFATNVYLNGVDDALDSMKGSAAGAAVSIVAGAYEYRIDQMDFGYKTAEDLRNTSGFTDCMSSYYNIYG